VTNPAFEIAVDDYVATVRFNRPQKANALDLDGWLSLRDSFRDLSGRPDVRAVILAGAGANFCAGIDLALLGELTGAPGACPAQASEALLATILDLQDTVTWVEKCSKPVIAAIHGACFGGGIDIACAADIRLATMDARFCVKEVDMAVIADLGTIQRLPGIVGQGRARELIYTGRTFDGTEAAAFGFVNAVYADEAGLIAAARSMARTIALKSPVAIRGSKESLNFSRDHDAAEGLRHVAMLNAARLRSHDLQEALAAFHQRRPAVFKT
jgi:enoyl-CoA hydratase